MEIVSFKTHLHLFEYIDNDQFRMDSCYLTPAVSMVNILHVGEVFQSFSLNKYTSMHVSAVISAVKEEQIINAERLFTVLHLIHF